MKESSAFRNGGAGFWLEILSVSFCYFGVVVNFVFEKDHFAAVKSIWLQCVKKILKRKKTKKQRYLKTLSFYRLLCCGGKFVCAILWSRRAKNGQPGSNKRNCCDFINCKSRYTLSKSIQYIKVGNQYNVFCASLQYTYFCIPCIITIWYFFLL